MATIANHHPYLARRLGLEPSQATELEHQSDAWAEGLLVAAFVEPPAGTPKGSRSVAHVGPEHNRYAVLDRAIAGQVRPGDVYIVQAIERNDSLFVVPLIPLTLADPRPNRIQRNSGGCATYAHNAPHKPVNRKARPIS